MKGIQQDSMNDRDLDPNTEFVAVDGDEALKWRQMLYGAWKEGIELEKTEDGFVHGGVEYERKT